MSSGAVLLPQEGRIAIDTDVGSGMRWTQESGAILARRTMFFADGEDVWFWRPKAGVKFAGCEPASDGDNNAWSPGRARRKPLKPSRRECRWWGCTCG